MNCPHLCCVREVYGCKLLIFLGITTIRKIIPQICSEVGLGDKGYTNHSIRATTLSVLSQHMIPIQHMKKISGHRSDASVESYANRLSESNTIYIHDQLQAAIGGNPVERSCKRGYRGMSTIEEETITLSQEKNEYSSKKMKITTQVLEENDVSEENNVLEENEESRETTVLQETLFPELNESIFFTVPNEMLEDSTHVQDTGSAEDNLQVQAPLSDLNKTIQYSKAPGATVFHGCVFHHTSFPQ